MWTPVVNIPIPQYPGAIARAAPQFLSYALGWGISDYQGHRIVSHGGAVLGSLSLVVLIPDLDVGFVILENCESDETRVALQYELLDHYLQQPEYDWAGAWSALAQEQPQATVEAVQRRQRRAPRSALHCRSIDMRATMRTPGTARCPSQRSKVAW